MKRYVVSACAIAFAVLGVACAGEAPDVTRDRVELDGRRDIKIAIVGAGPSGLTAAWTLKQRRYNNVTVFERNADVGGKVKTMPTPFGNVELGAVFASPDYPVTLSIADAVGIKHSTSATKRLIFDGGVTKTAQEFLLSHYTPEQIGAATQAYAVVLARYPQIFEEKLSNLPPELMENFDTFAAANGIEPIGELAKSLIIGFGYGFYDDVPAIYIMKILFMLVKPTPTGPASPTFFTFDTGFQSLWRAVAQRLGNVKLNSNVIAVRRDGRSRKIKVTVEDTLTKTTTEQDFDVVIISAPLPQVAGFVKDLPQEQKDLFAQVHATRYVVSLVQAPGVIGGQAVFVHDNAVSSAINHVGVWANPAPGLPVFQTWQITDGVTDDKAILKADMAEQGGMIELPDNPDTEAVDGVPFAIQFQQVWPDYFPRVSSQALKDGFFDEVEDLQGCGGLFYVGGSLSFETVETSAAYAKQLVEENFPVRR